MWNTDTVYLQTVVETNVYGSLSQAWTNGTAVLCDVQDISKDYAFKNYGLTDANEMRQIFDHTLSAWKVGDQVSYNSLQWIVRKAITNMDKIGASNHIYVIISQVI